MPIIKSAKKRVKVARKATIANAKTKRTMREAVKSFKNAVAAGNSKNIIEAHRAAISAIDQAVKKDVIHKNKAARVKSSLTAQAKTASVKPAKAEKPIAKAKPAAKKAAPAKKPAAKKPATKK